MKKRQAKAEKALDKEIERLYYQHAEGLAINILDIPKVFAEAHKAHAAGGSIEDSIKASVAQFCAVVK